ncbi:hypothetical protein NE237_032130 [Protea cynaroides]|uniref:Cyclic nucleotide-binding domain-containing protein n=1 Tax=Protea cynaroides TaxID=273540 RepID=A0A9Q0L2J1_9MAGN|nr:hypothetical protein NE237_032130 [Protea cynaroides]
MASDDESFYASDVENEEGKVEKRRNEGRWLKGGMLNPRAKWIQEWNRVFLLVCSSGICLDPLFLFVLATSEARMCIFVDGWFAITVTALRCMIDAFHVCNMCLRFKMAKLRHSSSSHHNNMAEEDDDGEGDAEHSVSHRSTTTAASSDARSVALQYLKVKKGFFLDLFVILPIPQVVLWVVIPSLLERGSMMLVMTVLLITFMFQYLPKIYHFVCLLRRMQNLYGYSIGTIRWNVALNLIAIFVASHVAGASWYVLGIQRVAKCLMEQCRMTPGCVMRTLACEEPIYYGTGMVRDPRRLTWAENKQVRSKCIESTDNFDYGAYEWTLQLALSGSRLERMLLPFYWGLMNLCTFGNLQCSPDWAEAVFNIVVQALGFGLVFTLIGNIKLILRVTTTKIQEMPVKMRTVEGWMKRRRLPPVFQQRVRQYVQQSWAAMRGVDEGEMIKNLPEGLRRDIKYHLCLDLVRQVPLFQHMDELVIKNICVRVKTLLFPRGETITREGDPVRRMIFVVRGHLQNNQVLRDGVKSCCMLGPGNFCGDELLSWCLRRPFVERLPPSSSTLVTLETTEVFGLEAEDLKYVTQHFRSTFANDKMRRSARYYSPGWRTWAAVAIQLAWRRYRHRLALTSLSFRRPGRPLSRSSSPGEDRLRLYTALLTSPKPNEDDLTSS